MSATMWSTFRRQPSNCEPVRRQFGFRHVARAVAFLPGVALMDAMVWWISPHASLFALGVNLLKGTFAGGLLGFVAAAQIPLPPRRPDQADDAGTDSSEQSADARAD